MNVRVRKDKIKYEMNLIAITSGKLLHFLKQRAIEILNSSMLMVKRPMNSQLAITRILLSANALKTTCYFSLATASGMFFRR